MSISKQRCCFKQSISCTRGREVLIAEQRSSYRGFSAQYFRNINLPSSPVTNHFLQLLAGWNLTLKESIAGSWLAIICQASLLRDRASSHQQMKPFQCFHWCWLLFFHQHFQLTIAAYVSVCVCGEGGGSNGNIFILYLSSSWGRVICWDFHDISQLKSILENHSLSTYYVVFLEL